MWTSVDIKYVKVLRDDEFWHSQMEPFLCQFYTECLLPKIVDSRRKRSMPIREPAYILQGKEEAKRKKELDPVKKRKLKVQEALDKAQKKILKTCAKKDVLSIATHNLPPQDSQDEMNGNLVGLYPNGNWVVTDSDDDADVDVPAVIALINVSRQSTTLAECMADVLPTRNLLNDSSIDFCMEIVKENSEFRDINATCYTAYYKCIKPCSASKPDMQIMGGNKFRHWCCVHYDGSRIKVYDSLCRPEYECLNREEKRYMKRRYGHVTEDHFMNVKLPPVTKRSDGYSCGVYSAALATTVALGGHPEDIEYSRNPNQMREHLITIIKSRKLSPFPTESLHA